APTFAYSGDFATYPCISFITPPPGQLHSRAPVCTSHPLGRPVNSRPPPCTPSYAQQQPTPLQNALLQKLNNLENQINKLSNPMCDPVAAMPALPQIYIYPSEMPTYRLYNGTRNPYLHVKEFLYESSRWQRDPITLTYLFRKSLDGPALEWFYSLETSEAGDFHPLHKKFLQRELLLLSETPTEVNNPRIIERRSLPPRRARPSARWAHYVRKYLRVKRLIPKRKPKSRAMQETRVPPLSFPFSFQSSFVLLGTFPWVLHIPSPREAFYFHLLYNPSSCIGHRVPFCTPYSPFRAPRGTSSHCATPGTSPLSAPRGTSPSCAPHGTSPSYAPRGTSPSCAPRGAPSFLAPRGLPIPFSPPAHPDSLPLSGHRAPLLLQSLPVPSESPKSFLHSLLSIFSRVLRLFSHYFRGFSPHMSF
ncbi:hypothetical protein Taro_008800, partial [Colocasia esculenta]|nr:hypothetical protein [Colocasia esculenta]